MGRPGGPADPSAGPARPLACELCRQAGLTYREQTRRARCSPTALSEAARRVMTSSHWKPIPATVPAEMRQLVERLRGALSHRRLSLRRLSKDPDIPYSVTSLHRFFSGQTLPPWWLVEVVARRCDGDVRELSACYRRAREALSNRVHGDADARSTRSPGPAHLRQDAVRRGVHRHGSQQAGRRKPQLSGIGKAAGGTGFDTGFDRTGRTLAVFAGITVVTANLDGLDGRSADTGAVAGRGSDAAARRYPPPAPMISGEHLRNGVFTDTTAPWWQRSGVRLGLDRGRLRADVPGGTREPEQALVACGGLTLRGGERYTLAFAGSADAPITIQVTVQTADSPRSTVLLRGITLRPTTRRFSVPFTPAADTTTASLGFQVGGHRQDRRLWLDDVSLTNLG
jgi:hypothetical protein